MSMLDRSKTLASIVRWNPWTWIALLFASQVMGSVLVTFAFGLNLREVNLAILFLVAGMVHATTVRFLAADASNSLQNWVPAAIYAAFIFSISNRSFSGPPLPVNVNFFHPFEYAVLAIFFCWMGHTVLLSGRVRSLLWRVIVGGFVFAVLDEFHQSFIPGRSPSLIDILLDVVGLCLGCSIFLTGRRLRRVLEPVQSAAPCCCKEVQDER